MIKINEELKNLIESNPLGLASADENGNPHCIAVAYVKVVSDNQILITDAHIIETTKNIKQNPNVSLVVWNKNWEDDCFGYILKGTAEHFTKGKWYQKVSEIAENEGLEYKGAILVTIDKTRKIV
ncbi:MAG: pyridoxamine 5'-phosphate oxidase family protein [Candidatus Parcubacteria bacterium]|nr:pyridoxamine 5'-phosphate oxidase family protein [Candidatus Parcubacteria bacterium]